MAHTCPWWFNYTFDNPLRNLVLKPEKIFAAWVRPGMTVLDVGCGMGYNSLGLARMVGDGGRVVSVDLQSQSLAKLGARAVKQGLAGRIEPRQCGMNSLGLGDLAGSVDVAVTFWMVHEVPDQARLFAELAQVLKPGGRLVVAEPKFHVDAASLEQSLALAAEQGLAVEGRPEIFGSHTAVLSKAS